MDPQKVESLIGQVLAREFPNIPAKQRIDKYGNRLNFSCPYCGDSNEKRKKRGNFYMDTQSYKCYNGGCGIFKSSLGLFHDFGVVDKLDDSEKAEIKSIIDEARSKRKTVFGSLDITMLFDEDINRYLIPRDEFMKRMNLVEIRGSSIERYLTRRHQYIDSKFAWDKKNERIYLFNMTPDEKILGLQVRNMNSIKGSPKYLTYKLSVIWEKLLRSKDSDFILACKKVDPISSVFNVSSIDFGQDITIFEGPMDSWLWKNSVGLCSSENKFPFDVDNVRFWYDWDQAGISKSIEMLTEGYKVFNWGKFLEENAITKNKKWDLNDIVVHLRATGKKIKKFENYFTNDILDMGYFINS